MSRLSHIDRFARWLPVGAALVVALLASPTAAGIAPLRAVDGSRFPAPSSEVRATHAFVSITPDLVAPEVNVWWVDTELVLRNASTTAVAIELAALDEAGTTESTRVWVNGEVVRTEAIQPRQPPDARQHTYAHARRFSVELELGGEAVVRVRARRSGTIDGLGRVNLELPTQALGLFVESIVAGRIQLVTEGRVVGLQSTVSGGYSYGDPLSETAWTVRQWEPQIPFAVSFWNPWAAIQVVAEVEACPAPMRVVRAMMQGDVAGARSFLERYDDATLRFCASLPEILHGRVFESPRTVEQLAAMTLDRYFPGGGSASVYAPDPSYSESSMSELEAIYGRALRTALSERGLRPLESPE